jgi:hypothetical protein
MQLDVSIVLELDNARQVGDGPAERLIAAVAAELAASARTAELIVVHDPACVPAGVAERLLARWPFPAGQTLALPGGRYYTLKNAGAAQARGAVVLFLDSDIVIEPGFVAALLDPFAAPNVSAVTSECVVGPLDTRLSRAMALTWIFPVRSDDRDLRPALVVNANSFALRREVALAYPFAVDVRYRGACAELGAELRSRGITTWQAHAAKCNHPSPQGLGGAARRALWTGYDIALNRRRAGAPMAPPAQAARALGRSLDGAWTRIRAGAARVGAPRRELPALLVLAAGFELTVRAGYLATRLFPKLVPALLTR